MAYDASNQVVILYGGTPENLSDTVWMWDGQRWHGSVPLNHPTIARDGVLVYDPVERLVLRPFTLLDQVVRTWDGHDWTKSSQKPPAEVVSSYGAAWDEANSTIVQFGGQGAGGFVDDTWTWDGTRWRLEHPIHTPPARSDIRLVYDPGSKRVLLMGRGSDGTWAWDGSDWTQLYLAHSPAPFRLASALALDPLGRVVLFGGRGEGYALTSLSDTWAWTGADWQELHPKHHPPGRAYSAMAYDAARHEDVLFGGTGERSPLGDTWTWDGTDWRQR